MCGIIGYAEESGANEVATRLKDAMSVLVHRGPDSSGIRSFRVGNVTLHLCHTRLAILDLSEGGHQPMVTEDGRFAITYNGEIYNYKELKIELEGLGYTFGSSSDTEVLLKAWEEWGTGCLSKLIGMFGFCILDIRERRLTLVRDAFGIKPVYYCNENSSFIFASEPEAIRRVDPRRTRLNRKVAYRYLVEASHDIDHETFIEGVSQVKAGHFVEYDLEKGTTVRSERWYWPSIELDTSLDFEAATERIRELFLRSVELHLRSDVPLGAAVSGGIDSSAIVCAARALNPDLPIKTFSYVARGLPFNEEKWIDLVNGHVGAVEHKFEITPDDIARDIDDLISVQGEPFKGSSICVHYRTFREAAKNGVKVGLDGQGGDEVFAGYDGYPVDVLADTIESAGFRAGRDFLNASNSWPGRSLPISKLLIAAACDRVCPSLSLNAFLALKMERSRRLTQWLDPEGGIDFNSSNISLRPIRDGEGGKGRFLAKRIRRGLIDGGIQNLLRTGDRCSMRWSFEGRVPFLTPQLMEFALSLPHHFLVSRGGETKHIFRQAMRGIVPDEILFRRDKIGAKTPERALLVHLCGKTEAWKDAVSSSTFVDSESFFSTLNGFLHKEENFNQIAWRMFNLFQWMALKGIH